MGDGKLGQLRVGNQARTPAGGAPVGGGVGEGQAIAAEAGHGGKVADSRRGGEGPEPRLSHACDSW